MEVGIYVENSSREMKMAKFKQVNELSMSQSMHLNLEYYEIVAYKLSLWQSRWNNNYERTQTKVRQCKFSHQESA